MKASQTFCWPSWVIYDQSFRQEMVGRKDHSWARVYPSLYSVCFFGQNASADNWCGRCQSLDHASTACPMQQNRKRPWPTDSSSVPHRTSRMEICQKFNQFNAVCKFARNVSSGTHAADAATRTRSRDAMQHEISEE